MIVCDLCGQPTDCLQKEIEGKEYDICAACWNPIAEKLAGKGRAKRKPETVFLPPMPEPKPETEQPEPHPGEPPKIWGRTQ